MRLTSVADASTRPLLDRLIPRVTRRTCLCCLLVIVATSCRETARLAISAGMGPNPQLPAPVTKLIPTTNVAKAIGWGAEQAPVAADGMVVSRFAEGLDHPRWLYVLPNGDVLVAETNGPKRPEDEKGIKAFFRRRFLKKSGGAVPSANRITLLRDADGDGRAEIRSVLVAGLNSPFGMALVGSTLYVANTDALIRFPYVTGQTRIEAAGEKVSDLPGGALNHHWTKSLLASADGTKLFVGVGSNSNAAENGIGNEGGRASIWEIDVRTHSHRELATGLRNPVGMALEPETGALWTVVNERDELGSDLVPDYMTAVRDGGFYGFPYSYFGQHVDNRVKPQRPDLVRQALTPDYALGPHTASLGLAPARGNALPTRFASGMFIGQHGSWNRSPRSGYKVIFVPFETGRPAGVPSDVLTGFLTEAGEAMGRPVGVALDSRGSLLVADDVGNVIWRVRTAPRDRP